MQQAIPTVILELDFKTFRMTKVVLLARYLIRDSQNYC